MRQQIFQALFFQAYHEYWPTVVFFWYMLIAELLLVFRFSVGRIAALIIYFPWFVVPDFLGEFLVNAGIATKTAGLFGGGGYEPTLLGHVIEFVIALAIVFLINYIFADHIRASHYGWIIGIVALILIVYFSILYLA